jgi:hypothetical protein
MTFRAIFLTVDGKAFELMPAAVLMRRLKPSFPVLGRTPYGPKSINYLPLNTFVQAK